MALIKNANLLVLIMVVEGASEYCLSPECERCLKIASCRSNMHRLVLVGRGVFKRLYIYIFVGEGGWSG